MTAANESEFCPPEFSNPEFVEWVTRTARRLRMVSGASDSTVCRAICWEGVPSPTWVAGIEFAMSLMQHTKKQTAIVATG